MIDRRGFVRSIAASCLIAPLIVHAQSAMKMHRIGTLSTGSGFPVYEAPLRELGWLEGKNIVFERRMARRQIDLLPGLADELVRLKVDMIIADGTPAVLAAKNATKAIPIVMAGVGDPVATGLVSNLARPGGNITGYSIVSQGTAVKRAALLHELLPGVQRVAMGVAPDNPASKLIAKDAEAAYRSLGIQAIFIEYSSLEDFVAHAFRQGAQALDAPPVGAPPAAELVQAAMGHRLPVVGAGRELIEAGGLMSFEVNSDDIGQRIAALVDKILRGAKPGDLPIEQPTRFELIINLKAAKALGITVPQSLLLRADEVIR